MRKNYPKIILAWLTGFLSAFSFLQGQPYSEYYAKYYNKQNQQLPENFIADMLLDNEDKLFIALPYALYHFNGYEIIRHPKNFPAQIINLNQSNNIVSTLALNDTFYAINKQSFHFFNKYPTGYLHISTKQLVYDNQLSIIHNPLYFRDINIKNLFTAFSANGIDVYTRQENNIYSFRNQKPLGTINLGSKLISDIVFDKNFWVLDHEKGIFYHVNKQNNEHKLTLPFDATKAKDARVFCSYPNPPLIILENRAWVLDYNLTTRKYAWRFITASIPSKTHIKCALYSKKLDKIFLGTVADGIIILHKNHFKELINYCDRSDILHYQHYLQIPLTPNHIISNNYKSMENANPILGSFFQENKIKRNYGYINKNTIIGYTKNHFYQLDLKTLIPKKLNEISLHSMKIFADFNDRLFILGTNEIHEFDRLTNSINLKLRETVTNGYLSHYSIINKQIWISYYGGITVYDPIRNTIVKKIKTKINFTFFFKHKNNTIISSYGSGLFRIDSINYTITKLKSDYYNALKQTHFLYKDKRGFIWAATDDGLLRFPESSLDRIINGKDFYPAPQYFDSRTGLPTDEFNGGMNPVFLNFGDSLISACTAEGIIQFYPVRDFRDRIEHAGINIKYVKSINDTIEIKDGKIKIEHDDHLIRFGLNTVFWGNPRSFNLYYRLDSGLHYIPITDLLKLDIVVKKAGLHKLTFLYIDDFGNEKPVLTLNILKDKIWYLKPLNFIAIILVLLIIISLVSWMRSYRIEQKNEKLNKIIDEKTSEIRVINKDLIEKISELTKLNKINNIYISVINHDIFAPIKYINVVGDKIYDFKNKLKKADIIQHLELIVNSTKRLEILCSNILNERTSGASFARFSENISIYQILYDLKNFIKIGLQINQNEFTIDVPEGAVASTSPTALNIILTNIVSNANRFTKQGKISVSYHKTDAGHCITVTDTGNGMPPEVMEKIRSRTLEVNHKDGTEFQSYGIGYTLIFKMLDVIDGEMTVDSVPLKGTSVSITFPDKVLEQG